MTKLFRKLGLVVTMGLAAAGAQAQDITGAGASFPAPIYSKWASDYNKATGIKVNYQSVGSGAGIKQIDAKTVSFGASDMPLTDKELETKGQIQFPTVVGGVVPVVNIAGVSPGQLKLTGAVLADIFLGKVKKWNDLAITGLNAGVKLPDADIAVVHRSDGSGTTFAFANWLSQVSPDWKSKVGEGTALNWPAGTGGKGNEGVAQFVSKLPNSIGYVEYAYVKQNKMTYTQLQNRDGQFVSPDDDTFKAAAANANWEKSFYQILGNQPGKTSWPITSATFILMYAKNEKPEAAAATLKFFNWAYENGDAAATALDYVPLDSKVVNHIRATWAKKVTDAAGKPVAYK